MIKSVITNGAARALDLKLGDTAYAIINATEIMIATD